MCIQLMIQYHIKISDGYDLHHYTTTIIGASLSEPHTNQYYKKTAVLMYMYVCIIYVCTCIRMYVVICQTRARNLIAHAHNYRGKYLQRWPRLTLNIASSHPFDQVDC